MGTDQYQHNEREYNWAVQLVLSALLSDRNSSREEFPALIAEVFGKPMPDLENLGLGPDEQTFVRAAVSGVGGLLGAMGNLAGGRWGIAQFLWIPRAVEYDLGSPIAAAFRTLVADHESVSTRVDSFRDQLYVASQALQQKGGFDSGWQLFRVSLAFVAVVLAGYDPTRYTFYMKGALRHGY